MDSKSLSVTTDDHYVCVLSQAYTAANLSRYHIVWRSSDELGEEHADVQFPNTQYDVKIECDVMYTFQVATVNLCGMGPLSNSVQEMCSEWDSILWQDYSLQSLVPSV